MVIVLGPRATEEEIQTVIGVVGGAEAIDPREFEIMGGVERVVKITEPYKLASRLFRAEDTRLAIGDTDIGGRRIVMMAGPCAVESEEQMTRIAASVRRAGAAVLRGGAFKPRTSPYSFQGLGEDGLRLLRRAADDNGMLVVSEVIDASHVGLVSEYVDILQIGARNMQNFLLLKEVGRSKKPVLLKRGQSATLRELLLSAEYILKEGNSEVILCERGIRTFENSTRNTLDLSAIPVLKKRTHLPVIADPSHGTGLRDKVIPMARAAVAAGADGLLIEVHPEPDRALSDGPQSLYPEQFAELMGQLRIIAPAIGRLV
jgi:3-deoxy-7-phosphoheptulonate synthase